MKFKPKPHTDAIHVLQLSKLQIKLKTEYIYIPEIDCYENKVFNSPNMYLFNSMHIINVICHQNLKIDYIPPPKLTKLCPFILAQIILRFPVLIFVLVCKDDT